MKAQLVHRWLLLALLTGNAFAAEIHLESLGRNGILTWTGPAITGSYRVEWAPTATGPWSSTWATLTNLPATGSAVTVEVPMFYRVVHTPAPVFSNVTAAEALGLITNRTGTANFVVVDVRTPGEFAPRHVKGALNLNFYAADFATQLAALDRTKAFLVYCASGNRSGQAVNQMRSLGFIEVYNLTGGFGPLAGLPLVTPWLEP